MSQLALALIFIPVYILIYYLVGVAVSRIFKFENNPVHEIVYGMFAYGILFFVYVLPLKFKLVPVTTIGVIWAVFVVILCLLIVILLRKYIVSGIRDWLKSLRDRKMSVIVVSVFTAILTIFVEFFGRLPNGFNQVWFVGWVSTGVVNNELMTHDTVMGTALDKFNNDRYLCTFMDHSAVVCKLTGMHPMVEVRTVLTAVFILVQCIVVWELAKYFGNKDEKKTLVAFFVYWIFRILLVGSQLLPGYYTFFRTYEGKGFVMNAPVPLIALLLWRMYDHPEDKTLMWKGCLTMFGAMTYSLSMMFTAPFMLASYIPFILARKDKRLIRNMFAIGIIVVVFFMVYYLGRRGTIDLTIHRM